MNNPSSDSLTEKKCAPCEGGTEPLSGDDIEPLLAQIPGWQVDSEGKKIFRRFEFKGFYKTMAFINAMAWIANKEAHHPDFEAGYNFCLVHFTTHAIDGLSENDFICAAKLNALLDD
ncbi:MAG: 4a-hydroxytetrahydrobiopterin dehydratase [Wenzhouxiangella sp.]|jgi:4a-hydroxytetrahydrobiopterin dehydratase|nr:4a-hydroxytetrahydrobiopterin dehydratase [Wenzhouxiangella sp.]